jgi:hypothetical protein
MDQKYQTIRYLVFDLDGTAIPAVEDGLPSPRVVEAVGRAREHIRVSAATGRSLSKSRAILDALGITDPCIMSGGTQLIHPITGKVLWQKSIDPMTVDALMHILPAYTDAIHIGHPEKVVPLGSMDTGKSVNVLYVMALTKSDMADVIRRLTDFPDISPHFMVSWTKDRFDVHITDSDATKRHAMDELLALCGVSTRDVMVVGDGGNDLPLFEGAGLTVAMGNADSSLKEKADIITGSVDDDGLAQVIEEVILGKSMVQ